jgi:putative oxygen-independent coproporphyrinogen III oxidase
MLSLPPLTLYIHLPWCEHKCPYCDFNSWPRDADPPFAAYVARLLEDLGSELEFVAARTLASIFIGGGTPSLFPARAVERLLTGVRERVAAAPDAEITLEANPGSAEAARFRGYHAAGVNRLSIGVQSFEEASLRALGRVHDAREAHAAVQAAREAGFTNINIDLMHGLPGQSPAMAMADLGQAIAYEVPHISWYQLTLEPNTVFYNAPPRLPAEDELAQIQDRGEALLLRHGYEQYEVSAWARPGHRCRHNLNYWRFGDYLGIGAGAHGKLTQPGRSRVLRTRRTRVPRDYLAGAAAPIRSAEAVPPGELALEFLMNALRLREGVEGAMFESRTGLCAASIAATVDSLRARGLLESDPARLCTTPRGFRYLDAVLAEFA